MNSILKDMYYGNILSFMELNPRSEEYDEKLEEILKLQVEMFKKYPEAKEFLDKYFVTYHAAANHYEFLQFQMGVRVGAQLMLEMMKEIDE
ncbi:MAG: hypothetical protein J6K17_01335 [Oscillospiraceae bacterium]|nr:hypothetical protein [Oscillospiraceae bacterium]